MVVDRFSCPPMKHRIQNRASMAGLFSLILSALLAVQVATAFLPPLGASASAALKMVICTEDGVREITMPGDAGDSGDAPGHMAGHCPLCIVSVTLVTDGFMRRALRRAPCAIGLPTVPSRRAPARAIATPFARRLPSSEPLNCAHPASVRRDSLRWPARACASRRSFMKPEGRPMFCPATKRLGVSAILMCTLAPCALAQAAPEAATELTPITVERPTQADGPMSTVLVPRGMNSTPAADGAAVLATAPGLTAGRMGGHGLELVIRGQQQNQLNIIDAGSFTYGACPNRMDPPTSSASFLRADEIVIERGYASVTHGPGGSGGAVILERDPPQVDEGKRIEGTFVAGTGTNGTGTELGGTLAVDLGRGFYI